MEAIKKIIKTKNNKITLDIPNEFKNKNIEIIMIPSEEEEKETENKIKLDSKNKEQKNTKNKPYQKARELLKDVPGNISDDILLERKDRI